MTFVPQLAVSATNQLYVWGANPQILQLNMKERRMKEQQARSANEELSKKDNAASNEELIEEQDGDNNSGQSDHTVSSTDDKATAASNAASAKSTPENLNHMVPELINMKFIHEKIIQVR
jgi:uncharacterized caspase-like protein